MGEDYNDEYYREKIKELIDGIEDIQKLEYFYWFIRDKLKVGS